MDSLLASVLRTSELVVALVVVTIVGGVTTAGYATGRHLRDQHATLREPLGVLQGAPLGVVGLVLAFGLTLAVGRYEDRRAATVDEGNAIGTSYLRAQLITAVEGSLQRQLWRLAGESIDAAPLASAPRLYVDSLNTTFDSQSARLSALDNRVPGFVLALEVLGAAVAVGLLAFNIAILGRGLVALLAAAGIMTLLLLVTFDLDRPARGIIKVPDTPLVAARASMILPSAAAAPASH